MNKTPNFQMSHSFQKVPFLDYQAECLVNIAALFLLKRVNAAYHQIDAELVAHHAAGMHRAYRAMLGV